MSFLKSRSIYPASLLDKREPGLRQYTHKWMIYVTTPPGDENIASFISCVRYHLHPSYKPNDVIDVNVPPFHLSRLGWGEFPIRVQLHFADSRRNKLVDVFHQLKVCIATTSLSVISLLLNQCMSLAG